MKKINLLSVVALIASIHVNQAQAKLAKTVLECYVDERTDSVMRLDIANVASPDGVVRWAMLHTGGPLGVKKTNFFLATNCQTGVTHLKDKDGVSFAGGLGSETPAVRRLKEIACAAKLKK